MTSQSGYLFKVYYDFYAVDSEYLTGPEVCVAAEDLMWVGKGWDSNPTDLKNEHKHKSTWGEPSELTERESL